MCLTSFIMLFWCRCAFYRIFFLHFFFLHLFIHSFIRYCCCCCSHSFLISMLLLCARANCAYTLCVINRMQYAIIWNAVIIWRKAVCVFCCCVSLHSRRAYRHSSIYGYDIFYKYVIAVKLVVIHDFKVSIFAQNESTWRTLPFCIARASISDCVCVFFRRFVSLTSNFKINFQAILL